MDRLDLRINDSSIWVCNWLNYSTKGVEPQSKKNF